MRTAIGHLDADCFYVSAERVRDRFLCEKPVGVLGNQGACVIAKSYEMKASGVRTGDPIWEAVKKCPQGVYIKRDFRWYEVLSQLLLEVVREASPAVEYYSIDEFFFLIEPGKDPAAVAEQLRDRCWQRVGVPVTVGIARSRTLAKLISDSAKPFGAQAVLGPRDEETLLARLPVTEISGIANRRAARLAPHGITTCLQLARADRQLARTLLTRHGEVLWWELNGQPVQPIHVRRPPHQALSRGGSLGGSTADPAVIFAWLVRSLERLIEELDYHGVRAGRLTVWVGYRDGLAGMGEGHLSEPSERFDLLLEVAKAALRRAWRPGALVDRLHLIATALCYGTVVQRGLFERPASQAQAVAQLKHDVNTRVGRFALRSAATLPLNARGLYRDPAHDYDICDVRGKSCF